MALPSALAFKDILWIVIPGIIIVVLFSPLVGIHWTTSDLPVVIVLGAVTGYVADLPLAWLSEALVSKVSCEYKKIKTQFNEAKAKWDFAKLWTLMTPEERSYFIELDAYKHLHQYVGLIFLLYLVYNLLNLKMFGIFAKVTILGLQIPSFVAVVLSLLTIFSCFFRSISYTKTLAELHEDFAKKYQVSKV